MATDSGPLVTPSVPKYLADTAEPVRDHLSASTDLPAFLSTAGTLSLDERKLLVEQAIVLLEQNYVHLTFKTAMHAVNPFQQLRVMRAELKRLESTTLGPEWKATLCSRRSSTRCATCTPNTCSRHRSAPRSPTSPSRSRSTSTAPDRTP